MWEVQIIFVGLYQGNSILDQLGFIKVVIILVAYAKTAKSIRR